MKGTSISPVAPRRWTSAVTSIAVALSGVGAAGCGHFARGTDEYRLDARALLHTRERALSICYAGVLAADPAAEGRVRARFSIAKDTGQVADARIEASGTTASPELQQCVLRSLDQLELAPPDPFTAEATFLWIFKRPGPTRRTP